MLLYKVMFEIVGNTYREFVKFLTNNNVIGVGLAFIIATQVGSIAQALVDNIISPIINAMSPSEELQFKDVTVNLLGAEIEIGKFIQKVLQFLLIMTVIFIFFKIFGSKI